MSGDGAFQGGHYRIIRKCYACPNEVDIDGEVCWQCAAKAGQQVVSRPPWYRRIAVRGYIVLFGVVFMALLGLLALARLAH